MRMEIKSLYLENFEGHAKTKLNIAPDGQLTVIVGPTDSGKSSLIRALRWVLYNVPQGTDYIRAGCSHAVVAVTLEDDTMIVRERGRSYNRYRIARPGASDDVVFEGFGSNVPLEIVELTGVREAVIGELSLALNLAEQLDGPFLGRSISAGARARVLGQLAGTEEIDHAARTLHTDLHRAGQDDKRLTGELEALDERISSYDYLPALAQQIERLETVLTRLRAAEQRLDALVTLHTRRTELARRMTAQQAVLDRWAQLEAAVTAADALETRTQTLGRLTTVRDQMISIDRARAQVAPIITRWAHLDAASAVAVEIETRTRMLDRLITARDRLAGIDRSRTQTMAVVTRWQHLDLVATLHGQLETQAARSGRLIDLRDRHARLESAARAAEAQQRRWKGLEAATARTDAVQDLVDRARQLVALRDRHSSTAASVRTVRVRMERWTGLDQAAGHVASAEDVLARHGRLIDLRDRATQLRQQRVVAEHRAAELAGMIADAESQYRDTLAAAGVCPTCGTQLDHDSIRLAS